MKWKIQFLVFSLMMAINSCVNLDEFCSKPKNKCPKELKYECLADLCSKNRMSCHSIKMWRLVGNNIRDNDVHERFRNEFQEFAHKIANCSKNNQRWQTSDVCLNGLDCWHEVRLPYRLVRKVNKIVECKCIGDYGFRCDQNFCAKNKAGCEGMTTKSRIGAFLIGIVDCNNNFLKIK